MEYMPTKHNYELVIADAKRVIKEQKDRIEKATAAYIKVNAEFAIGDIIKITSPEHEYWTQGFKTRCINPEKSRFAFVVGYEVDSRNDIKYLVKEQKKDGTISKKNDYYSYRDILTFHSNDH